MQPTQGRVALALSALMVLSMMSPHACAWSNGGFSADPDDPDYGTHDWIADQALALQSRDVSFLETTYHITYLLGTEAPDNPEYIGDTVEHHVYYYSSGALQDDSSAARAQAMYDLALARLEAGDFSVAAYYTGAMTHYIADLGVFGHTMGAYTDWGAEVHHSDYEAEFEDRLGDLDPPSDMSAGNETAYDAATGLARDITFGSGDIRPNTWMDEGYDWSDSEFVASAYESLHESVRAVAAAINHLMYEAGDEPAEDDDEGDGDETEEPTVPSAPRYLEAHLDGTNVVLTWVPPLTDGGEPIIEYQVFRSDGVEDDALVDTVSVLTVSWSDSDLEEGGVYAYSVRARNSVGLGDPSQTVTVTVPVAADADGEDAPWLLAAVSAILAVLGSGGVLAWRRSRRDRVS